MALQKFSPVEFKVDIEGISPLVLHRFSEKARKQMRDKKLGITGRTRNREACDPEAEMNDARYLVDGVDHIPAMALKNAIIGAAHRDIGIMKTDVRKSLFLVVDGMHPDNTPVIVLQAGEPRNFEAPVTVGQSKDLRWRPMWEKWAVSVKMIIATEGLPLDTLTELIQRAGFGVGVGEWRPEKGGDFGRFQIPGDR